MAKNHQVRYSVYVYYGDIFINYNFEGPKHM